MSLIKFLIRASTRPTPYGLFAGVALGEFSDSVAASNVIVDEKMEILECRVDHSWLSHFVYELENNPTVYKQLKLRFNNNCYVSGDRLKNPHYSNHGFAPPKAVVVTRNHIRNTPLISYIKQKAQTFIHYKSLNSVIQEKYPDVSEEKIEATINMLIDSEVLLTNLRVPSNCVNGLEYILEILEPIEGIDQKKEALRAANMLVNQINGEHEIDSIDKATIESIYTLLEELLGQGIEKDLLAVNKGMVLKQNKLPYELKDIIENFVEGLTSLQVDEPSRLEKFKQKFQEEYGSNVEVPLCDIIDQNVFNGLSYLDDYNQSTRNERDKKIKQIVDEKILYCLQSQCEEVVLSRNDFSSFEVINEDRLPKSFDINIFITKKDDRYNLSVAPAGGSGAAGDMFNRFSHVLDAKLFNQYKESNKSKMCFDPDVITVEIREGSTKGRLVNINNRTSKHSYYIALATNDDHSNATELFLDDFLIGMQNDRLYIKSKSLGKRCKIVHDCMINTKALSDVTQFLLYVSADDETSVIARTYALFGNTYVFMPRIVFESVVIQPKSWTLPSHLFDLKAQPAFAESLKRLRHKYNIDDIVYLSEFDNRLMVDLTQDYSIEIIYKHIKKGKILKLDELEQNMLTNSICVNGGGDGYVSEISCSMMLSSPPKRSIALDDRFEYELQDSNRSLLFLQDGWVYIKLYNMDDRENEVLKYISASMLDIGHPKLFYLRYSDDFGKHLRVRFKYEDDNAALNWLYEIRKLLMNFREHKLINKVQFDIYFRENNRYGGRQLIELAEDVFFSDSLFVINLLSEFNIVEDESLENAYLLAICSMLSSFYNNPLDMFNQVNLLPLLNENKKLFREKKQANIMKIERLIAHNYSTLSGPLITILSERREAIKRYNNKMGEVGRLTHSRDNIIASFIHMFCNRLTGNRNLEHKYLNIIRESLSNIIKKANETEK